ncbi:DNA methyltransferase [Acidithiobacillus sp. IBUN Pt1247-S3]|uniref:DNA methyltransferase n=1 Tax=Acidithiobacillus sp. IBUN Pt1247-S3 TaxID=3166642 RepID=UPI0034E5E9CF
MREVVRECCAPGEVPDSYCGSTFHKGKSRDARKHLSEVGETPRTAALRTVGWRAGCGCPSHDPVPATVLDPFGGSGTVAMVAKALGRDWEIIEANPDYVPLAEARLHQPAKPQRGAKQRRGAKSGDVRLRGLEPDHLQPTQQMELF